MINDDEVNVVNLSSVKSIYISEDQESIVDVKLVNGVDLTIKRHYSDLTINLNRDIEDENAEEVKRLSIENDKLKKAINHIESLIKEEICFSCDAVTRLDDKVKEIIKGLLTDDK